MFHKSTLNLYVFAVCQIASYALSRQVVDYVSSGLWGGAFMIASATLILLEKYNNSVIILSSSQLNGVFFYLIRTDRDFWILTLTCLSLASGLIMVIIYSWNLNRFFQVYTTWEICEFYAPGLLINSSTCKKSNS